MPPASEWRQRSGEAIGIETRQIGIAAVGQFGVAKQFQVHLCPRSFGLTM
jgi:hypothetical protein